MRTKKLLAAVLSCCTALSSVGVTAFAADTAPSELCFDFQCAKSDKITLTYDAIKDSDCTIDVSVFITENPGVNGINLKLQVNDGQVAEDGSFGNYGLYLQSAEFANPYCFDSASNGDPSACFRTVINTEQMNFSWVYAQEQTENADSSSQKGSTTWTKKNKWGSENAFINMKVVVPQGTPAGDYVLDVRRESYINWLTIGKDEKLYGMTTCVGKDSTEGIAYKTVPLTITVEDKPETTTTTTLTTTGETTTSTSEITTTTETPEPGTSNPGTTTEAPVTTTTVPPVTTTEPVGSATTEPPVTSTEAPVTTTTVPPVTSTEAPVTTTTEPPVTSTEAPVTTTTVPPVTSTEAPVTTSTEGGSTVSTEAPATTTTVWVITTTEGFVSTTTEGGTVSTEEPFATTTETTVSTADTLPTEEPVTTVTTDTETAPLPGTTTETAPVSENWVDAYDGMDDGFYMVLPDVSAQPGETVSLPIYIYNDPGSAGMQLYWTYSQAMTFQRWKAAPGTNQAYTVSPKTNNKGDYPLSYVFTTSNGKNASAPKNGAILAYMVFEIPETAKDGTLYKVDFYTENSKEVLEENPYCQVSNEDGTIVTAASGIKFFGGTISVVYDSEPRLNYTNYTMTGEGEHVNLTLFNATGSVTWKSSNEEVATVDKNGFVTSTGTGSCEIIATCGGKDYVCTLAVGLFGDVDGSGKVDLIDANMACLYYNLVEVIMVDEEDYNLTPAQAKVADVDLNGKVDTKDSTYIMYYYNYVYVVEVDDITWYDIIGVEGVPGTP